MVLITDCSVAELYFNLTVSFYDLTAVGIRLEMIYINGWNNCQTKLKHGKSWGRNSISSDVSALFSSGKQQFKSTVKAAYYESKSMSLCGVETSNRLS